jgi:GT2 family glycosyltransferase
MYKDGNWLMSTWNLYHYTIQNFVGCAFICRKDTIVSVGGFDEGIKGAGEDVELVARIRVNGWSTAMSEGAEFYHNYRATLLAFLMEHRWFGYGAYYLSRKYPRLFDPSRNVPPGRMIQGLKVALTAYRSSRRNISFLIPLLLVLANIAWWFGFLRATIHGRDDS